MFTLLFSFYQWGVQISVYEQHSTHSFYYREDRLKKKMPMLTISLSTVYSIFILLYLSRSVAVWFRILSYSMRIVSYMDLFTKGRAAILFLWKMYCGIYDSNIAHAVSGKGVFFHFPNEESVRFQMMRQWVSLTNSSFLFLHPSHS